MMNAQINYMAVWVGGSVLKVPPVGLLLLLAPPLIFGQTSLLTLDDPSPQANAYFGNVVAGVGDVNGDSVPDIGVVAGCQDVGGFVNQGQAFVFSGADGSLLFTLTDPAPQTQTPDCLFGHSFAGVADMNGDSISEIAEGARRQDVGGVIDQGQVFIFSGADGSLLFILDDPTPETALFGDALEVVGDINGDSVPDIAVGAYAQDVGGNTSQGQVFVFSGTDRSLILTLDDPTPQANAKFSFEALASMGDVNGDSVPDIAVGAYDQNVGGNTGQGQAFVFSGADGSLLLTLDDPTPQVDAAFGLRMAGVGDVNGDSVPDLVVAAPGQSMGGSPNQGQVFVFSGADGSVLFTLDEPGSGSGGAFGDALAGVGDQNDDSVPDIIVGQRLHYVPGFGGQGRAFVFSGADGALLFTLDDPNSQGDDQFGRSVASVGDVNGDFVPDIVVGAHLQDVGGILNQGQVFIFSSDIGGDGDGIPSAVDNCPSTPNPDQSDIDGQNGGDVCDVCPNDPTDACDPGRSAGGSIGPDGGVISTPDGSVTITVPPGALDDDTSLSITDSGNGALYELTTNLGQGIALFGVTIQPDGQVFNVPVTITFSWADADDDGTIDDTSIHEDNINITKDNIAVTDRCRNEPGPLAATGAECDTAANTFSFQITSLSDFTLFSQRGGWIRLLMLGILAVMLVAVVIYFVWRRKRPQL